MEMTEKRCPKVLLIAPYYDRNTPGESWSTYKWVQGISERCRTIVLTQHRAGWNTAMSPVDAETIVNWKDPTLPLLKGRAIWELAPTFPLFYLRARQWIKKARRSGEHFDLIHQINPLALRYPCPAQGLGYNYMIGPLAGSLPTPAAFADEQTDMQWFRKLRYLDRFRFQWDPWLRQSYEDARALLGAAPYVEELLADLKLQRFECIAETGVEEIVDQPKFGPAVNEPLRLLFVGRIIRTKGIVDAIRAMAFLRDLNTHLDIIGDGDLMDVCRAEVEQLQLSRQITFHGRLPRDKVFEWYRKSHLFFFPSFREPSGNVIFEAMSQALPVVTSSVGGPGYVVDETCGRCVPPESPQVYPERLAAAVREIAADPDLLSKLSAGALLRMEDLALWPRKIDHLMGIYSQLIAQKETA